LDCPTLFFVDAKNGILILEEINGKTVREWFLQDAHPWNGKIFSMMLFL
jgi:tRNA A-37 threonylcarbamoyl transferase component Bud32